MLVVLDGIRLDVSRQMTELQALAERGSSGSSQSALPSLSNPNRAVLVTGAWPAVNGVTNNRRYHPPPVDSLFTLADAMGMPRAAAGASFWGRAFGESLGNNLILQSKDFPEGDPRGMAGWQDDNCRQSGQFLTRYESGFLAVDITAADAAGHDFGGESEAYREVVQAVDRCLGSLVSTLDDGRTVFAIVSDHGHIQHRGGGGHGGPEPEVLQVPLVFAGQGIRKNHGWQAQAVDVAPTIAVLLGLPFPATNQGQVLWHSLDLSSRQAQQARARFDAQQKQLAAILPDGSGLAATRGERALLAFGVLLVALVVVGLAFSMSPRRLALLMGVSVYFGAYYLLFASLGLGYSLSIINREELLLLFLGKNLLAASAAFGAVAIILRRRAPSVGGTTHLAMSVIAVIAMQIAWIHYRSGIFMDHALPDLGLNLKAALDLLEIATVSMTAALIGDLKRRAKGPSVGGPSAGRPSVVSSGRSVVAS